EEKKIQDLRIKQTHLDLDLIKNNLRTEDVQTRAQLEAGYEIIENTRIQLKAAEMALKQSQARYDNGLSSVVQLAEASQSMAQARLEEAQANIGIWKVLLSMAALRGDLKPFISLTQQVERRP
ncbi:MAG: TolC family protein, partial [Candidatus Obscuribacterales bacterium]|nr:TolC family protein [Candidatus Obscuribacterales bacterium]